MTHESSNRLVAAVIGVGKAGQGTFEKGGGHQIGYMHAETFQANPRVHLAAGADISAENLRAFQAKFGVEEGFLDYKEMLRELKPDLVSIGTYVGLHCTMIEDAARAGVRGIICEKPFVASPAEMERVRRVAEETGVKIVVAHVRRHFPAFQRARDLYNDGTVGEPLMCMANIAGWDLSEWGSHWLDMFRFFHNDQPINWVMGQARVRDTRGYGHAMEEHAVAYFEFENGGKALLDGGMTMNGGATMTLLGTKGTIRIFGEDRLLVTNAQGEREESFANDPGHGYPIIWGKMLKDLIVWIDGGNIPLTGLPHVLQSSELNLAAYLSALRGDRVDLPLSDELKQYDEWPLEAMARRVQS